MVFSHPNYTVLRELGRGASAVVYLAVDKKLNRKVAIKVLHDVLTTDQTRARFRREALILARLEHPHIVPVYELGELADSGGFFIAMRYVDGGTLSDRVDQLSVGECLRVVTELATALDYAHANGYLHRDIKPDNILFDGERAMLTDFGIARPTQSQTRLTQTGERLGTPEYMSPEQVSGGTLTACSDLYSLGIVFYEMLTGSRPFASDSTLATGIMHMTAQVPPLPAALTAFTPCIHALLNKSAHERLQNSSALIERLAQLGDDLQIPLSQPVSELRNKAHEQPVVSIDQPPERRQLTVVCCQLVDFEKLSVQLDPELLRELIGQFHRSIETVVQQYEGTVAQRLTDGLVIYFGHPIAHEDDAKRAVHACMAISPALSRITELLPVQLKTTPLRARMGVHTGPVVIGGLGGLSHLDNLATGETPVLASRLQQCAAPNATLVSTTTSQLLQGAFTLTPLDLNENDTLIGTHSVVYQVSGLTQSETRFSAAHSRQPTTVIGRDNEFRVLDTLWRTTRAGAGQCVLISGDAGIGKSCLVDAMMRKLDSENARAMAWQCSPYHRDSALFPVAQHLLLTAGLSADVPDAENITRLATVIGASTEEASECAVFLGDALGDTAVLTNGYEPAVTMNARERREQVMQVLIRDLVQRARVEPILIVLEDAHWADPTTLALIDLILPMVTDHSILLVVTARPEFEPDWSATDTNAVTQLPLKGLEDTAITQIVRNVALNDVDMQLTDSMAESIVEKTDGVPLFAEELTKAVLESAKGGVSKDGESVHTGGHSLPVPTSLHDALIARLDRLSAAKYAAQVAACIGRQFRESLLFDVISRTGRNTPDELARALSQLVAAGILTKRTVGFTIAYTFSHALVRDVAYESLLKATRRTVHNTLFQILQTRRTAAELLAYHATEAEHYDEAVEHWEKAGDTAVNRAAFVEAIAHFGNGLSITHQLEDTVANRTRTLNLHVKTGHASTAVNGFAHPTTVKANMAARSLLDHVGETPYRFPVLYGHWVISHALGNHSVAANDASDILSVSNVTQERVHNQIAHRVMGASNTMMGRFDEAIANYTQFAHFRETDADRRLAWEYGTDPFVSAQTYNALCCVCTGDYAQALDKLSTLEEYARDLGHSHSLMYALSHLALVSQVGNLPGRARYIDLGNAFVEEHDLPAYRGHTLGIEAMYLYDCDEFDAALEKMKESLSVINVTKTFIYTPVLYGYYAATQLARGNKAGAEDAMNAALERVEKGNEYWSLAEAHRVFSQSRARFGGDRALAIAGLERACDIATEQGAAGWLVRSAVALAGVLIESGESTVAAQRLTTALAALPDSARRNESVQSVDVVEAKRLLAQVQ